MNIVFITYLLNKLINKYNLNYNMVDNYASPLLLSNNIPHYNYSNSNVINSIHVVNNKSNSWCDKSNIGCISFGLFMTLFIIFLILYFK